MQVESDGCLIPKLHSRDPNNVVKQRADSVSTIFVVLGNLPQDCEGRSLDEKGPYGFTASQRFFQAYSYSWCSSLRPELARTVITTNPPSMPQLRVDNVLSNLPEFWQAFGRKAGQPMVRVHACRVW